MGHWSVEKVLDARVLDLYSHRDGQELELFFLVDTRNRYVVPFHRSLHHSMACAAYLGISEASLSTATSGHIVGASMIIEEHPDGYVIDAFVGGSSMALEYPIKYTQATLTAALKITDDFIYRSPLTIKKRSVQQSARAA